MKKEKSIIEIKAETWLNEHGFKLEVQKQYISKTIYKIEKGGFETDLELPASVDNIKKYMESYEKDFEIKIELEKLKKEAGL